MLGTCPGFWCNSSVAQELEGGRRWFEGTGSGGGCGLGQLCLCRGAVGRLR